MEFLQQQYIKEGDSVHDGLVVVNDSLDAWVLVVGKRHAIGIIMSAEIYI